MKKMNLFYAGVIFLLNIVFYNQVNGQSPEKLSYQSVIRNTNGTLVTGQAVGFRLSILQGSVSGTVVFSETQNATTNANGLVSLVIGNGTPTIGSIGTINWSAGPYFLKTETDPNGGTNYSITGTSELMSVPYALYAENSGTPGPQGPQGLQGPPGPTGPAGAANINGTANYVTKFTSSTDGGNSQLYDDGTYVGVGTTTPAAKLDVAGNIKITDGTEGAGKVLTSDANGLASWAPVTVGGSGAGFKAETTTGGTSGTIVYDVELVDDAGAYDPVTGYYTIPTNGFYYFNASITFNGGTPGTYSRISINTTNGVFLGSNVVPVSSAPYYTINATASGYFTAGTQVYVDCYGGTSWASYLGGTFFTGFKVY